MLRQRLSQALKAAMKERDATRLSTLRLINAAIKDKDIELRGAGREDGASEDEILALLSKMVKSREESARIYEEGGRLELAEKEREEMKVISEFLPKPLTPEEIEAAINEAIAEVGASSIRDMGKVMAALKQKYTGRIDFGKVGPEVKKRLA